MSTRADKIFILKRRADFMRLIRRFFESQHYLEVETPLLSPYLIPEPALEVFATRFVHPYRSTKEAYLIPSPELWMKRLLSCGVGNIFQLTKCFRNSESLGRQHNPEFTMLEWYSPQQDYLDSIDVLESLLAYLNTHFSGVAGFQTALPLKRLRVKDAFRQILSLDLDRLHEKRQLQSAAEKLGLICQPADTWEMLFNQIFLNFIEPELAGEKGVMLTDYPAGIITLAKESADPRYAQRWELYLEGFEIANCYTEETDPRVLRTRIAEEHLRKVSCLVAHPPDAGLPDFFHAEYPPCSGTALGVDRLFMCYCGLDSISQALFFPFKEIFAYED